MPKFPKLLFFHPGNLEQGEFYFSDKFPSAEAVADPEGEIYGSFNFHEGNWFELFHPKMFAKAFQAYQRGQDRGKQQGIISLWEEFFYIRMESFSGSIALSMLVIYLLSLQ